MPTLNKPGNMTDELNQVIPGFSNLTKTDSGNINNLLSGLPSPSIARNAAAYYGVGAGVPGSEYANNKGFDMYNQQADTRRASGHQQLLQLLQGVSGTAIATPGQQIASADAAAGRAQQGSQFNRSLDTQTAQQNRMWSLQALLSGRDPSALAGYENTVLPSGKINTWNLTPENPTLYKPGLRGTQGT